MTLVTAHLRYFRQSPRKVRLVADLLRGTTVARATALLENLNKRAARPLLKLLNSAVANAKHNFKLESAALVVRTITVDGGPVLKRWLPRAHGRATPVRERTAHVSVVLAPRSVRSPARAVKPSAIKKS